MYLIFGICDMASTPQSIINAATAAQATELGRAAAAEIFKDSMKSVIKINTQLSPPKQKMVQDMMPEVMLIFSGKTPVTHDHPVMYAFREVARQSFMGQINLLTVKRRALVMGATQREVRLYNSNPAVHYYFHMSDSKDTSRVVPEVLEDLLTMLQKKAAKTNKRVFSTSSTNNPVAVKRYLSVKQIYEDYRVLGKLPDNFHFDPVEATTLIFEDSMYDVSAKELMNYFEITGAVEAHGYMVLPLEFYFPELPKNDLYQVTVENDRVFFNYRYGHSNGYCHKIDTWREFGLRQAIKGSDNNKSFDLFTEITGRYGPMVTFKITKTASARNLTRLIELPRQYQYVKMLDVWASVDMKTGKVNKPLVYFSVYAEEYYEAMLWLASLAPDSRKLETIITYIRRRKGGVALQSKELLAPWHLSDSQVYSFCLTIYLLAKVNSEKTELIKDNLNPTSVTEKFFAFVRQCGQFMLSATGLNLLYELLFSEFLTDKLVLFTNSSIQQDYNVDFSKVLKEDLMTSVPVFPEGKDESELPSCKICLLLKDADIGDQKVLCDHKEVVTNFTMTEEQCGEWFAELADDDTDPAGLRAVKAAAKKNVPRQGFSHNVKLYNFVGFYGTGKSYIIKKLASEKDLVLAPFTKLMTDYTNIQDKSSGDKYDLLFKTAHRGLAQHGADRIFCDEYPSLDFRYLMATAYLNQVSEVYIFGDMTQTVVQEPEEGWNISNHMDLSIVSSHKLLVNHRNRPDTLALCKHYFGDELEGRKPHVKSMEVMRIADFETMMDNNPNPVVKMCFTHDTRRAFDLPEKSTVRSSQGGTYDRAALYVTNLDNDRLFVQSLQKVALTRHKEMLYIVHDDSPLAHQFLNHFGGFDYTDEFVFSNQTKFDDVGQIIEIDDLIIKQVISDETVANAKEVKMKESLDSVSADVVTRTNGSLVINDEETNLVEGTRDYVVRLLLRQNSKYSDLGLELVLVNLEKVVEIPTGVVVAKNPPALKKWCSDVLAKGKPICFNRVLTRNKTVKILLEFNIIKKPDVYFQKFGRSDCLIRALASALDQNPGLIAKVMKKIVGADQFEQKVNGDGFNLLDLDLFGKNVGYKVKVDIDEEDRARWGEFPDVVGKLDSKKRLTIMWSPGHWSSENSTLGEDDDVEIPLGTGVGSLYGFDQHNDWRMVVLKSQKVVGEGNVVARSKVDGTYYQPCYYLNEFSVNFNEHINFFSGPVVEPLELVKPDVEFEVKESYENVGLNAHKLLTVVFPDVDPQPLYPAANTIESQLVFDNFRAGVVNTDVVCDVNPRGHLRKVQGFYSIGSSKALYYEKMNNMQTLQVISERYANKNIRQFNYSNDAEIVATQIAEKFCYDCFSNAATKDFDNAELNAVMVECEKAMRQKHYESQTDPDSFDSRVVRFHLKNIAKPKVNGDLNLFKAGQGISAWSKTAQSWFGKAMRILNARFGAILNDNVIYDNRMTEEELITKVNLQLKNIHRLATRGVTDCDQFDSVQNMFTQSIERNVLKRLGASDMFLDLYYSFRRNYIIQSTYTRVKCNFEKTSGEPGTLLLNTILSMVLTYYLFEGDGKFVIVAKGDDGFRSQLNLRVNEDNLALVNKFCQLGLKLSFDETVEFCGNVIVNGCFYPSIFRKLAKIAAHRFRDYKHFCEYQISLRDWESKIAGKDVYNLCFVNSIVYGTNVSIAQAALDCIKSFAHINEVQFYDMFKYRSPVLGHYVANQAGGLKFFEY